MSEEVIDEQAADEAATSGGVTLTANAANTLIGANDSRERLIVSVNVADVWLGYGVPAVVGVGYVVRAGGSPFEERSWKGSVSAVSAGPAVVGWTETAYNVGDDEGEETPGALEFVPHGPSDGHPSTDVPDFQVKDYEIENP